MNKIGYCTEYDKRMVLIRIQELRLTGLFVIPWGHSGWVRRTFTDAVTGEMIKDIFPILN